MAPWVPGATFLIYEVAKNYINNFLRWDIKNISQQPTILQSTEYKIITSINQNGVKINFKGIIDRIDRRMVDGTIRIIDYKTGRVLPGDLVVKNIEDLTTDPNMQRLFRWYIMLGYTVGISMLKTGNRYNQSA